MNVQIDIRRLARVEADYLKATRRIARFEVLTDMIDWSAMTIEACRNKRMMESKLDDDALWLAVELDYLCSVASCHVRPDP
ncbi:hypothetical protein SAMN05518849_12835 [Sphingobium sp. AP50]|uniref:hypothetical protein n=1 Tax=Sphingobium sp. AP50 TaxID=1884369 RepID=UPI0008CD38CF|nr:hypothetical protein [Sphingobium sp. AP50]SEK02216.1 hypothetical protein SAMN05518849_12835 [Sphingobium sp. AP50]